ncbi:hypothetical protein ACFPM0_02600 [Pseudonocardia sulfidoxydans]|uniref:hypothetical protein n=1 Tax=Pseudonocardia sulfidoxydans TaxID=54011 RepID=UPI00361084C8
MPTERTGVLSAQPVPDHATIGPRPVGVAGEDPVTTAPASEAASAGSDVLRHFPAARPDKLRSRAPRRTCR